MSAPLLNRAKTAAIQVSQLEGGFREIDPIAEPTQWERVVTPEVIDAMADVFEAWARIAYLDPDLLHRVGGPETLRLARLLVGVEGPTDE